ncbi:uncharacterized protein LOC117747919 isoform X2 [Cyclopterus lumpus]|uniref:uncharacterized protein LOC117747919 isoform X2 n=1 Tax=Cyclopterus lumpus TaxID=8103 RepID=UPI00148726EB|nr:uncharacterized protein LOC117747919 isoform X2 [Cyclopterus lumpus]
MKLTAFFFCGCLFSSVGPPAAAAPHQVSPAEPQADSPIQVSVAAGADVLLPCSRPGSAGFLAVEWTRVDGPSLVPSLVTVLVFRDGEELVKEKAADYVGRTHLMENGSLKLLGVRPRDSGTYSCVQVLRSGPPTKPVLVSLSVAQVSQVYMSIRRSPDDQLLVLCESSGWTPAPLVSLQDSGGRVLAAQTESSVGPDGLYAVSALVNVAAAGGSSPLVCKVEIPALGLANQEQLHITDDFHQDGLAGRLLLVVYFVVGSAATTAAVLVILPLQTIKKLRSVTQRLTAFCMTMISRDKEKGPEDYGDINYVETTGSSQVIPRKNEVDATGLEASHELAKGDLEEMNKYKQMIFSIGENLRVPPALIAAIISRQSRAGAALSSSGYGAHDADSFGLMQINKRYHAVKGGPFSEEHVDQGVTFLIQLIKTMKRTKPGWTTGDQLKGALACYISGEDRVLPLTSDQLDSVTPRGDFANDVVARAHWFSTQGF